MGLDAQRMYDGSPELQDLLTKAANSPTFGPRETSPNTVKRSESVARWKIAVHGVARGRIPGELHWLRHLDSDDQAKFLDEAIDTLEDIAASTSLDAFEELLTAWRTTALALSDKTRREILLGRVNPDDFADLNRPEIG